MARTRIGLVERFRQDRYAVWDARPSGAEWTDIAAHLSFYNLANTQYEEIQGVVMPGRSVLFGLEFFVKGKRR